MTNRQRLGAFLLTSALAGGFALPTLAAGSSPQPSSASTSAQKPVGTLHAAHKSAKITARLIQPVPEPVEIASVASVPSRQCNPWCSYPLLLGTAY